MDSGTEQDLGTKETAQIVQYGCTFHIHQRQVVSDMAFRGGLERGDG